MRYAQLMSTTHGVWKQSGICHPYSQKSYHAGTVSTGYVMIDDADIGIMGSSRWSGAVMRSERRTDDCKDNV